MASTRTRAPGELERAVMQALWQHDGPLTAREIGTRIAGPAPSYAAVITVLGRLVEKGRLRRIEHSPRRIEFACVDTETQAIRRAMSDLLAEATDRAAVLRDFLDALPAAERAALIADARDSGDRGARPRAI